MRVVNFEVYRETLQRAITVNFASSGNRFGFCSESYEYKSTDTPLAFYLHFIRVHLGDTEMYEEMERLKLTQERRRSVMGVIPKLMTDIVKISKHNYDIPYRRYAEGKMNLVKNYFKHKKINYEKFS